MPWQIVPGLAVEGGQYNLKNQSRTVREGGDCASVFAVAMKGQSRLGLQRKRQHRRRRRNGFNRSPTKR